MNKILSGAKNPEVRGIQRPALTMTHQRDIDEKILKRKWMKRKRYLNEKRKGSEKNRNLKDWIS